MDDGVMDVVDLTIATTEVAEDIEKRKKATNLIERLKQAVAKSQCFAPWDVTGLTA